MSSWKSGRESGSAAIVVPQHAAQSLAARDLAGCAPHFVAWFDEPIVKPLMVSFSVIMGNEFLSGVTQRSVTEENHAVKAFFFYGSIYKHFYPGEQGKRRREGGSQGESQGNDWGQAGHCRAGNGIFLSRKAGNGLPAPSAGPRERLRP